MHFYLDEDQSSDTAAAARRLGLDVTCSHEAGRDETVDDAQLDHAGAEGRALVTRNADDFIGLTERFRALGRPHAGVLCLPPSLPNDDFGGIARALQAYDAAHPDGMPAYMVDWLRRVAD